MAEQLRMALDGGTHEAAAPPEHRRRRPPANRPVRGEPDLPGAAPRRGEWRIDQRTRLVGLRGIARARAALGATGPDGPQPGQVDAA